MLFFYTYLSVLIFNFGYRNVEEFKDKIPEDVSSEVK